EIAHGASPNQSCGCAFCGSAPTRTLKLEHTHTNRTTHKACHRCWHLASGFRGQAYRWSRKYYQEWVRRWEESMATYRKERIARQPAQEESVSDDGSIVRSGSGNG